MRPRKRESAVGFIEQDDPVGADAHCIHEQRVQLIEQRRKLGVPAQILGEGAHFILILEMVAEQPPLKRLRRTAE